LLSLLLPGGALASWLVRSSPDLAGLGGKRGAGVPGYGVPGWGKRGVWWKRRGPVENAGSGGKRGGLVENARSK